MNKTKIILLIIAAIVIVGCLLYIPQIGDYGLYRDDWNNFYNLVVRGPQMLISAYEADRPADGYLIVFLYKIFGTKIIAYHIWNLCCRILGSVFFALSLWIIRPEKPKTACLAGILCAAFPGFLQQIDGIAYVPHQTAMLCFMCSLWLSVLAFKSERTSSKVIFTGLSLVLSFGYMMLMEYFIGMEIYRFGLIYVMSRETGQEKKGKSFFRSVLFYVPYLIPAAGFLFWRLFVFQAVRAGADVGSDIIRPLLTNPFHEIGELAVRIIKSEWKLFAGVWTVPAYNLINGLSMKEFVKTLIPVTIVFTASLPFIFIVSCKSTEKSANCLDKEATMWLWFGLVCGSIAIIPLIVAGRDINFSSSLDRFSWPGMIGTTLFLIGFLESIPARKLRNVLLLSVLPVSFFVQWQNQTIYTDIWKSTQEYWQQVIWRMPSLEEGTTIVTEGKILMEEDYEMFSPASMIYYPYVNSGAWISSEVLSENTIKDIRMGKTDFRVVREIQTEKDYSKLLVITKPLNNNSCMRVIDGSHPLYSVHDDPKIVKVGAYSKLSQIITSPEESGRRPFFLPEELEHDWCYYYEKMELALQMDDAELAASLADEAEENNFEALDPVEYLPVVEAYMQTGRIDDALAYVPAFTSDKYLSMTVSEYLNGKDSVLYGDFIDALMEAF